MTILLSIGLVLLVLLVAGKAWLGLPMMPPPRPRAPASAPADDPPGPDDQLAMLQRYGVDADIDRLDAMGIDLSGLGARPPHRD